MAIGTDTHTILEHYYETGERPKFDGIYMDTVLEIPCRSADKALDLDEVPDRHESILLEQPRDYNTNLTPHGVLIKARADLIQPGRDFSVIDWKTRGSRTFESPETLATDPQSIIYRKWAFTQFPDAERGRFLHIYVLTKQPGAVPRATDWATREEVDDLYNSLVVPVVAEMKEAAAKTNPDDVPFKKNCWAYGKKCVFFDQCSAVKRPKAADPFEGFDDATQ